MDIGGSPLTYVFAALLIGGIALLVLVGVWALVGGVAPPGTRGGGPEGRPGAPAPRSEARRILDERYARGELSADEYRDRVETLGEGP